jgi:hypothetical protein
MLQGIEYLIVCGLSIGSSVKPGFCGSDARERGKLGAAQFPTLTRIRTAKT